MPERKNSPAVEEYLETIYRLGEDGRPVGLTELAEKLYISPVSANEMVRKLVERELATYEPYKGVCLTAAGAQKAESIIRRHRLWERLLTDVLGMPWDQVHEEACRLEHATSDLLEQYLTSFLEQPATCPHGVPMPGREAIFEDSRTLSELAVNASARVVAVMNEDAKFLEGVGRAALRPGALVRVAHREPAMHVLAVQVNGVTTIITDQVAEQIRVAPISVS
jgi:DtxR family Mn-dependent transcriptional regulator